MTLDPRVSMWLNIICAVLIFTAGAGATLTDLFDAHTSKVIVAGCVYLGGLLSAANGVLHAIPSRAGASEQFPLGPSAPDQAKKPE